MDELKSKYNELLIRKQKGLKYYEEHPEDEETIKKLDEIQGIMDRILMQIGSPTPEEIQYGFRLKNELEVVYTVDNEEIKLTPQIVQEYITGANAGQITKQEFMMFAQLCKARKLNPFLKEAYCIKYSNNQPATIVVGKDALIKRANLHPQYDGMKSGIMVLSESGELIKRDGTFKLPKETLVGGWAEVFRKDWSNSTYASVTLEECIQRKKDGTANSNWTTQPSVMIEKVAKVRALREAFVEDLGGMYEAEEIIEPNQEENQEEKVMEDIL